MSTIKIIGTPSNCTIEIDGRPTEVMSLDLHLDGGSLPKVVITPPVFDVDENTKRTLQALGWTLPSEDGSKPEMSDEEFTRRLRKWIRVNPQEFERWIAKYNRIHRSTLR